MRWAGGFASLSVALLAAACAPIPAQEPPLRPRVAAGSAPTQNITSGCVADYKPGVDYFPQKSRFTHSAQLQVEYRGHWKRVTFTPAVDTRETLSLVLVQCGTPHPMVGPRDVVVEVPIRSYATANASMLGASVLLGVDNRLMGVPSTMTVTLPSIRRRIDHGEVIPVYAAGHGNGEQAAALGADLFFTFYSAYPEFNIHPLLSQMGAASAPQSDHTEPTPLGRAEWIKYLALFFNREARANAVFADRERRYRELAALTRHVAHRPLVQLGYPETRDQWSQAGGANNFYKLVEDAGGRHRWSDKRIAGSLTYAPMEQLYDRAADADIWIGNFMPGAATMAEVRRDFPRVAWLKPVRTGHVYWFDANKTDARNPWSDQGMTEPHVALAELIGVLHPEILPFPRRARFVRQIPGGAS